MELALQGSKSKLGKKLFQVETELRFSLRIEVERLRAFMVLNIFYKSMNFEIPKIWCERMNAGDLEGVLALRGECRAFRDI